MSVSLLFVPFHYFLFMLPYSNVRFATFCSVSSLFVSVLLLFVSISLLFVSVPLLVFKIGISRRPFRYFSFRFITFCSVSMSVSLLFVLFHYFLLMLPYSNVCFATFCSVSSLFVSVSLLFVSVLLLFAPFRHFLLRFVTFCILGGESFLITQCGPFRTVFFDCLGLLWELPIQKYTPIFLFLSWAHLGFYFSSSAQPNFSLGSARLG